jgi:hypothetical protein
LTYPAVVSCFLAMMAIPRGLIVASFADHTEKTFVSAFHQAVQRSTFVSFTEKVTPRVHVIVMLVLRQDICNNVLCNRRHIWVIRIVWQTTWIIPAAANNLPFRSD